MEIVENVEQAVREAYRGVVARDGERVRSAFQDLGTDDSKVALGLGLYVCGYIVNDIYRAGPTDAEVRELADQIVRTESDWIDLGGVDAVSALLRAAASTDRSLAGLEAPDLFGLTFVSGGHLLAAFSLDNQNWWEYLDQIWSAAEAG